MSQLSGLLKKAIDGLKHSGRYNGLCSELEVSLAELKLHELDVDVTSDKLQLQQEMKTIRDAIENPPAPVISAADLAAIEKERNDLRVELEAARSGATNGTATNAPPPLPPVGGVNDTKLQDRVRALEAENANLKLALAEAKEKIVVLSSNAAKADLTKSAASNAEVDALCRDLDQARALASQKNDAYMAAINEVEAKKKEIAALQDKFNDKTASISQSSAAELERAKAELAELKSTSAKATAALEANLLEQVAKTKKESSAQIAELEERLEKEKEEMMEALAQEVEVACYVCTLFF